jgi:hypothetical protein
VQRVRDQFLAGAALAADEHARLGRGHLLDGRAERLHGFRLADELLVARAQLADLPPQRRILEAVAHRLEQPLAAERLVDEVVDAELDRLHRLGHGSLAGHDDGRGHGLAHDPHQVDAAHPRQAHVHQGHVRLHPRRVPQMRQRILGVAEVHDAVPFLAQAEGHVGGDLVVVLDDEDQLHFASGEMWASGVGPLGVVARSQ